MVDGLPSGNLSQFAIENDPVEIVDFPMQNGWIFPILTDSPGKIHRNSVRDSLNKQHHVVVP